MTILQQPDILSLSGNIKEFRIATTETIPFVLKQGDEEIVTQSYDPGKDGIVIINVRDIVHSRLSFTLQESALVYEQPSLAATFTAVISGTEVTFRVIRSGVDRLADTATNFLTQNFLTWQPSVKAVTYYSPEFLTYYAVVACTAKLRAYFTDDSGATSTHQDITLANFDAGKAYTIPLQYASIAEKLGNKLPAYYDAWIKSPTSARLTYIQRYYASDMLSEQEQWILFENSLGGIDTFRAYGSTDFTGDHTHNIAEIDEVSTEYRIDTTRKFQKNTGHLKAKERQWLLDFFPSQAKYIYAGTYLRSIVVIESNVTYTDRELPSNYTFTYKYADARPLLNLPRTDIPSEALHITVPSVGSFTVPPRLVEFPRLPLTEGALFPIQNPYSEKWGTATAGSISDFIAQRLSENYNGEGGVGHNHKNIDLLNLLSYIDEYLLVAGKKIKSGKSDESDITRLLRTTNFIPGIIGAIIDKFGDGEMGSLVLRKFLSIPELRFNRAIVYKGKQIISPGGGCLIESFTLNGDGTWTIVPKLEEGEPLSQEIDDILLAYWHDKDVTTGAFKGFREMKFRVVSVDSDARTFIIAPKPDSLSVPAIAMTLAQVGNFTNKERQTYIMIDSTLGNNNITFFDDCNTWDIEEHQEQSWFGKKKGRTVAGIDASDYSAVLKHIIMIGLIFQVDEISGDLVRVPLDKGAYIPEKKYAYYDRVSYAGALWLCVNTEGTDAGPADGNANWLKQVSEGGKGDTGIGISSSDVLYYLSTSPTTLEGGSWQTDAPTWQSGKYMWTKTKIVYTDNSTMESTPVCITGSTGKGVSTIVEQYYLSTSSTSLAGGDWQTNRPTWQQGHYIWTRSVVTYTDNTTTTTDAVCVSGSKGDTGIGISSADVLYYLSTSSTSLEGGNWQTDAPTWQSGKYMWTKTKIVYTDNSTMESTPVCITGSTGKGVSTIVEQYYLSTSSTSLAGGDWQTNRPTWQQGHYIWTRSVVTYTDNTTTTTDAVCVSGSKGDKGDAGESIRMLGHWNSSMRPVPANCMVSYAKGVYLSLRETSQAPVSTLMYANGSYFLNETGGYTLASNETNEDWELILENGKNGVSILFQGSFPAAPANPEEGWSYYNTSDKRSYVFQGGKWHVTSVDGKDGKGFEWIFTRTKTNEKPIALTSEQQDDYVPAGWTDDPVGCTEEYIYEWTCKRVKKDGVWGAYSAASIFNMYSFSTIPQWSTNNVDWHDVFAPGDIYIRYSSDGGKTWTAGARAIGETGKDGPYTDFEFAVGESDIQAPADGWLDAPSAVQEGQYLWMRAQYIVPPATVNPDAWKYSRLTGGTGSTGAVGIIPCGHWQSANTPYKKTSLVTMHNATFVALVDTAKPPVWLLKWGSGPTDYLINHTGGYTPLTSVENNRNTEWLMITPPPVNGNDGNDGSDSTSYWLTSPVSTININSVGSLSPSSVLISCKKKKGEGTVSDCSDYYLAARKYNGSWLAHVSPVKAASIGVPSVAGYTQFAVRAYNSASEAEAWGGGFVSEMGVGVVVDGPAGKDGPAGSFPRNRDIFVDGQSYVWNPSYRDSVLYPFDGVYYQFHVANFGATVTKAPTSSSGDGLWESMGKYKSIATDTLFADGANVARFMFRNGTLRSQDETNGVPNLEMDGKTGKFKGIDVELSGKIEVKDDSKIAGMQVVGNSLRGVQASMGIYKHQITGNGSPADIDIIVNNIHQQQTYIFSITSSSNDIKIRLPSQHDMLLRGIDQYQFELTIVLDNLSYSSIRLSCNDDATIIHNLKTFSTYGLAKGGVLKLLYFQNKYFLISNSWGQTSPW